MGAWVGNWLRTGRTAYLVSAPLLSPLPSAVAHGYVTKVVIDGTSYSGNAPNAQPSDSPIRQISDIGSVMGSNNLSLNCGMNAQLATQVVPPTLDLLWNSTGEILVGQT
jgi:hypothetical protein